MTISVRARRWWWWPPTRESLVSNVNKRWKIKLDPHISIRVVTWLLIENPPGYFLLQIADVLWLFCDHPPLPFPPTKRKWYCSHSLLEHLDSWDMFGSILPPLHHHHQQRADIVRVSLCILILEHLDTCDWASSPVQHDHDYWVTSFQITKMQKLTVQVHLSDIMQMLCFCCFVLWWDLSNLSALIDRSITDIFAIPTALPDVIIVAWLPIVQIIGNIDGCRMLSLR